MTPNDRKKNEAILAFVERLGGGYVWEPEIFVVELGEVSVDDEQIEPLAALVGVQQIVLNAKSLSSKAIGRLAHIPGLESIVLFESRLAGVELDRLRSIGPEIELGDEEDEALA